MLLSFCFVLMFAFCCLNDVNSRVRQILRMRSRLYDTRQLCKLAKIAL